MHSQFSTLTDRELVRMFAVQSNTTPLERELLDRLERRLHADGLGSQSQRIEALRDALRVMSWQD